MYEPEAFCIYFLVRLLQRKDELKLQAERERERNLPEFHILEFLLDIDMCICLAK
jgi:hypothetical protein